MAAKIKKGDRVIVISGQDKGKSGDVVQIFTKNRKPERVLVRGINLATVHQKRTATQDGGIVKREMPIHISNVAMHDPKDGKPTRVGFKFVEREVMRDGVSEIVLEKVRYAKRSGMIIE
jgi:large subunit ribosomal protein L24